MIDGSDDEVDGAFSSSKPTDSIAGTKSAFGVKKSQ